MNLWLMENTGTSPLLRSRWLGSFLSTSSGPGVRGTPKIPVKKVGQTLRHDVCVGEDGWGSTLIFCVRMATCFITVMVLTVIWAVIMVVLIPWPYERIKQGNVYGHVTGRLMMWILGNHVTIEGAKFSNKRAIYICNHASLLDVFLVMWLTPTGSVGIAKKEVKRWTTAPLQNGLCSSGIANRSPNSSHGPDGYPSSMEEG
ncbi:hypothetical protein ACFX14_007495 [Malus domestica]